MPSDFLHALAALPPDASLTLKVAELRELLGAPRSRPELELLESLTVEQAAERLDRSPSTVRGWCQSGTLPGAFKMRGKQWRIPPGALAAFLANEADAPNA